MAGPEVQISARYREACNHPEIEDRAIPQRDGSAANRRAANGSGPAKSANGARGGAGRSGDLQDRAARCAHQAGVYGQAAGDRGTYVGTCINQ